MISDEVRASFLGFFESKGHKIIPSSPLIPKGDPTLLLTTAGMVQFKPYFLGESIPPNPRLTSCQKCFRMTDIESVGDRSHLTFFEMLGNFSVGDYFKREAISWGWEFVTRHLKLPPERLWVTVFLDDDESFQYWRETGVPEQRILRFGEEDNFWGPAGDSGPCGPCSEIHYDFGADVGCRKPTCAPNCKCGRFSEIWNLVFTQYNQDKAGHRTPLPRPNIDTGMGLERTVAAVTGRPTVYETDLFTPLLDSVGRLTGKKYGADDDWDNAMRVVVEHGRGIPFLIADGVIPGNDGRGYVLRRLIRRAALFGRRLGLDRPFLNQLAQETVTSMAKVYPELRQRQDFIYQVIELEEAKFRETLSIGLELLDEIMKKAASEIKNKIPGSEVFKLYDTYGFPVELTREVLAKSGFSIDMKGFDMEMEKQRGRARAAQKFSSTYFWLPSNLSKTTNFVGYNDLESESTVKGILVDLQEVDSIKTGQQAGLILEATPFYGEMGGQVGDTGEIRSKTGVFNVTNTTRITIGTPEEIILHVGQVTEGVFSLGDRVLATVDEERRLDIARNHTATHLLQLALRQVLGEHVQQRGSLVNPEQLRFDFSHLSPMTEEEIQKVDRIVNEKVRQDLRVYDEETSYQKAKESGAIALFDEKYGDVVRVLKIGQPPVSAELCGGTHISSTGQIGFFLVTGESSIGSGLRRIEAVTGRGAEEFVEKNLSNLHEAAELLQAEWDNFVEKIHDITLERDKERKQIQALERELAKTRANSLLDKVEEVNGLRMLAAKVPPSRMEVLREMSDLLRDSLKSAVVVLGTVYDDKPAFLVAVTPDLVARGYDAGKIVKQVARVTGGGGGGNARLAQAGGKDKSKLDEALGLVKSIIESGSK